MTLPVFSFIAAPQDQKLVLQNGAINPAWHRFFLQLPALMPKLATATTTLDETITAQIAAVNLTIGGVSDRVTTIEDGLGQPSVTDAATTTLTISAAYGQTEIQALETRVRAQAATINTLIARLEAAGVLEA